MYLKRFFNDIKKYYKYLFYSTKATLKTEVSGSYLAWFWWILEPFCFMLIYVFVATVVFKSKNQQYLPVFVFAGLTLWNFFNKNIAQSSKLLKAKKGIITKIYLPKHLIYIQTMMVNAFKMAISLGLCVLLMIFYKVPISLYVFATIPCLIMLTLITLGVGCLFMHIGVYVGDLANLVTIALRLMFYLTGIFYNVATKVPAPYGELLSVLNPVALALSGFRDALLYSTAPNWLALGIWSLVGLLLCVFGIYVIYKNENDYGKIL